MILNKFVSSATPRQIVTAVAFLLLSPLHARPVDLFYDDFSKFPPGWLSTPVGQLNGAIQEAHYLPNRGVPLGGQHLYTPTRNPSYNESNYRALVSLPHWLN